MTTAENLAPARNPFAIFNNCKIATKISIGFAVLLAILAITSVGAYQAISTISSQFTTYTHRVLVGRIARDLDVRFNKRRRVAREYALTGDETRLPVIEELKKALQENVDLALTTSKVPHRLAKLKEIAKDAGDYESTIEKLTAMNREQHKLIAEVLDPTGANLTKDIDSLQLAASKAGNANVSLLAGEAMKYAILGRLDVNKVLGRHNEASAAAAQKAFSDLDATLTAIGAQSSSDESQSSLTHIRSEAGTYAAGFKKAKVDADAINGLLNGEMPKIAEDIDGKTTAVVQGGIEDEKKLEDETLALVSSSERFALILGIAGIALGALLAWIISRLISGPIVKMTGAMTELAGGNQGRYSG